MEVIGRHTERKLLDRLLASKEPEFLALYGRRRVGKTFLIREHYRRHLVFELTGLRDGRLKEQLGNFGRALEQCSGKSRDCPSSWQEAFAQLADYLTKRRGRGKRVIFLDELPWLASPRSRFLQALDYFWNAHLSRDPRNVLVICGSAASWMIAKVIDHKGGLHNRLTARLKLEPFTLAETSQFLRARKVDLTLYDRILLAMVMGGVPYYLKEARPGRSAAAIIDECCFARTGLLRDEFDRLYASLFEHEDRHVALIRALAKSPQGLTRSTLTSTYVSGGRLTDTLRELEEAGFVSARDPLEKKKKDTIYRVADEYSLFYLKWIEGRRGSGAGTFLKKMQTPGWRAWAGYAFESLVFKHLSSVQRALGIEGLDIEFGSWVHRGDAIWPDGAQVDLVIDRADNTINLIEVKFAHDRFTIDKACAEKLRRKLEVFRQVSRTRKNVFLTFVTTHGLLPNAYANELVHESITAEALFEPAP